MFNNSTVAGTETGSSAVANDRNSEECSELAAFLIHTIIAGTLCVLGFASNIVSFLVLRRDRESPVASFQLQALALTDNFFLVLWFVHFSVNNAITYFNVAKFYNPAWMYLWVYSFPLLYTGQTATIWMTVLIAVSRYIAVCKPYKASQWVNVPRMKLGVFLVALFSFLYNVPRFFEYSMHLRTTRQNRTAYFPQWTPLMNNNVYNLVYFDILYCIFSFVLPLLLLAVLNTKLLMAYRVIQKRRNAMRSRHDHRENNITLVMIIVVLVFMLCNLPARVVQLVWKYHPKPCPTAPFLITEISSVLEVLNSSTNFIIYCAFRKQFRDILQQRTCTCAHQVAPPEGETTKIYLNSTAVNQDDEDDEV